MPFPVHLPSRSFGPPLGEKSIRISPSPRTSPSSDHSLCSSPFEHPGVPSAPRTASVAPEEPAAISRATRMFRVRYRRRKPRRTSRLVRRRYPACTCPSPLRTCPTPRPLLRLLLIAHRGRLVHGGGALAEESRAAVLFPRGPVHAVLGRVDGVERGEGDEDAGAARQQRLSQALHDRPHGVRAEESIPREHLRVFHVHLPVVPAGLLVLHGCGQQPVPDVAPVVVDEEGDGGGGDARAGGGADDRLERLRSRVVGYGRDGVREDDEEKGAQESEPGEVTRELQAAPSEQRGALELLELRRGALILGHRAPRVRVELVEERSLAVAGRARDGAHRAGGPDRCRRGAAGATERREGARGGDRGCAGGRVADGARTRGRARRDDCAGRGRESGHGASRSSARTASVERGAWRKKISTRL